MISKTTITLFLISIIVLHICLATAEEEKPLTQEQFAVEVVKNMGLSDQLPLAALPNDCITLLERLGISPLKGWNRKALLTDDDFTVIIAKAVGKEHIVHIKAAELCHKKIEIINERWQENPSLSLEELLNNKDVFPKGAPQCPYGLKYEDKDKDYKVDQHYHPIVFFKR